MLHRHHLLLLPRLLSFPLTTPTQTPSLFSLPTKTLTLAKTLTTATSSVAATATATEPPHIPFSLPDIQPQTHLPIEKLFVPPEVNLAGAPTLVDGARVLKGSNIVLGPYARDAQVSAADFVKSSARTEECPADGLPEFALVGRSDVGKSSLLNSLVRRRKLALTSKKPGKTQLINHFRINDSWYLVDLPGYGYASAPHELRNNWGQFTKDYFLNRQALVSVFLLIDASIPAKKIDLEYASWLGQNKHLLCAGPGFYSLCATSTYTILNVHESQTGVSPYKTFCYPFPLILTLIYMMLLSLECNGCRATITSESNLLPIVQRRKENAAADDGRRFEDGERNGRACPPSSPSKNYCKNKKIGMAKTKTTMKKKMVSHSDSSEFCCTSSVGSCDAVGFFGGGGDDKEAAAILSSTGFSSDSAEYYSHPSSSNTTSKSKNKHKNTPPKRGARTCKRNARRVEEEKVVGVDAERGVAVERESTDLYGDFRRSMVEMIMARRKLRAGDMSHLLLRYLSLNSPEHHPVIIKAFSDIYMGYSPSPSLSLPPY